MDHQRVCYQNNNPAPAGTEKTQCAITACNLLVDANNKYLGDDTAVFCQLVNADNDTREPLSFIWVESKIIGTAANDKAGHLPDRGHVVSVTTT